MTFYTVFVIDLASRRVRILGTTPHPEEAFMRQIVRTLTMADAETCGVLICDRDAKCSVAVRERLEELVGHTAGFALAGSFDSPCATIAVAQRGHAAGSSPWSRPFPAFHGDGGRS